MHPSHDSVPRRHLDGIDTNTDGAYLQLLIEHSPIAIVMLNSSHRAEHCNPTFERMFGFSRSEIMNRNFDELIAGEEMLNDARRYTSSVLHGEKVHVTTRRRCKDGTWIDVDMFGIPLMINGVLKGVYGLYLDISERTKAESSLRQLSRELIQIQENEKRRIGRELHDSTSQELALLSMALGKLRRRLPPEDKEVHGLVSSIQDLARQCTQKIRSASYLLHPPLLQEAGLVPAISWLAEGFAERAGIRVGVHISSKLGRLADVAELAIFRIVQESLSNVLRHSPGSEVDIRIGRKKQTVRLSVENRDVSGVPSPMRNVLHHPGVGIAGMRERMEELGGCLEVIPIDGGMTVVASLPSEERISA